MLCWALFIVVFVSLIDLFNTNTLMSGSSDKTVGFWNLATEKSLLIIQTEFNITSIVSSKF